MPGTFSPPPWISDPGMHHGTCVTHVPWCMPRSLISGFLWSRWRGKRSRRMRNPQFYVSDKRPMCVSKKYSYDMIIARIVTRTHLKDNKTKKSEWNHRDFHKFYKLFGSLEILVCKMFDKTPCIIHKSYCINLHIWPISPPVCWNPRGLSDVKRFSTDHVILTEGEWKYDLCSKIISTTIAKVFQTFIKHSDRLSHIVNGFAADGVVTQGSMPSAAMALT